MVSIYLSVYIPSPCIRWLPIYCQYAIYNVYQCMSCRQSYNSSPPAALFVWMYTSLSRILHLQNSQTSHDAENNKHRMHRTRRRPRLGLCRTSRHRLARCLCRTRRLCHCSRLRRRRLGLIVRSKLLQPSRNRHGHYIVCKLLRRLGIRNHHGPSTAHIRRLCMRKERAICRRRAVHLTIIPTGSSTH